MFLFFIFLVNTTVGHLQDYKSKFSAHLEQWLPTLLILWNTCIQG
jgi:hypothetical protein